MADKVSWFELPADDTARAGKFYADVFGWATSDMGGDSLMATSTETDEQGIPTEPGVINGDISPRGPVFDKPLIVITVDDMDAKIQMVEENGGKVAQAPQTVEVMNMKWAIVTDTEDNKIGIVQNL